MKKKVEIKFEPQSKFPYLHDYAIRFPIDEGTIFPYGEIIYFNGNPEDIPYDILLHEQLHCQRQLNMGVDKWIRKYLDDPEFRQEEEILAYRHQLKAVKEITNNDREELNNIRNECIRNLMSGLYGEIDVPTAVKALKI